MIWTKADRTFLHNERHAYTTLTNNKECKWAKTPGGYNLRKVDSCSALEK